MVVQKEKTPKPNGSDVFAIGGDKRDQTADLLNAIGFEVLDSVEMV